MPIESAVNNALTMVLTRLGVNSSAAFAVMPNSVTITGVFRLRPSRLSMAEKSPSTSLHCDCGLARMAALPASVAGGIGFEKPDVAPAVP